MFRFLPVGVDQMVLTTCLAMMRGLLKFVHKEMATICFMLHMTFRSVGSTHIIIISVESTHMTFRSVGSTHIIVISVESTHMTVRSVESTLIRIRSVESAHITIRSIESTHITNRSVGSTLYL